MAGGALMAAIGAGLTGAALVAARQKRSQAIQQAEAWFREHLRLPGPSLEKLGGAQVCIYQGGPPPEDWATFRGVCNDLYLYYGYNQHRARSRSDVQQIIGSYPSIARLVLAAHGATEYFFGQWGSGLSISAPQLAEYLRGRIAPNAVISLAGCSAGRSDEEPERYEGEIGIGGARSFAGMLRDQLAATGSPGSAEIRAHTTRGPTTENPRGRVFRLSEVGQGGRPISVARGPEAERWILAMSGLDEMLRDPETVVSSIGIVAGLGIAAYGIYKMVKEEEA
jgi:hypothetical protein